MLICIAGKNDIAVAILEEVLELSKRDSKLDVCVLLNNEDTKRNGWQKSLAYYADLYDVRKVKLEEIYEEENMLFLSLECDKIINVNKFKSKKLINIHFSLLPKYKGCYTAIHPILHGEKESGVTLHKIEKGIDTGDLIEQIKFDITDINSYQLYQKCMETGIELVKKWLKTLIYDFETIIFTKQNSECSSYYSRESIDFSDIKINWKKTAYQIKKYILAFSFEPYQLVKVNEMRIAGCRITNCKSTEKPGTIVINEEKYVQIATIDYDIVLYKSN